MNKLRLLVALLFFLSSFNQYADARSAITIATSTPVLREVAEQGDSDAQLMLGLKMQSGIDMPADLAEGAKWIKKAADQGLAKAEYMYGTLMITARGIPQDVKGSMAWMQKAADQGVVNAEYQLGVLLITYGSSTGPRFDVGLPWLRKAAEHGHPMAQEDLADCLAEGRGGKRDIHEAKRWYREAAEHGRRHSQIGLARLLSQDKSADPAEAYFWAFLATREKADGIEVMQQLAERLSAEEKQRVKVRVEGWQPVAPTCDCVNLTD